MTKINNYISELIFVITDDQNLYLDCWGRPHKKHPNAKYWKKLTNDFLKLQNGCTRCQSDKKLQLHHWTYQNFGEERPEDVELLCSDCHISIHTTISNGLARRDIPYSSDSWAIVDFFNKKNSATSYFNTDKMIDALLYEKIFGTITYQQKKLSLKSFKELFRNVYPIKRCLVLSSKNHKLLIYKFNDLPKNPFLLAHKRGKVKTIQIR